MIYSSDQGFYLGDHGWFDERWMYEESLRMPLLVGWPGVAQPGSENRDLVIPPIGQWVHPAGVLDRDGWTHVLVNGERVGRSNTTHFISPRSEGDPGMMTVGADTQGKATDLAQNQFHGLIEDVRLYWGVLDGASLRQWAGR